MCTEHMHLLEVVARTYLVSTLRIYPAEFAGKMEFDIVTMEIGWIINYHRKNSSRNNNSNSHYSYYSLLLGHILSSHIFYYYY